MDASTLLRHLVRYDDVLPQETATVTLKDGRVLRSEQYALAFIRKYRQEKFLREEFGGHIDFDDLQAEMLLTLWNASQTYLRQRQAHPEATRPFGPYLAQSLKARLWHLYNNRVRHDPRIGGSISLDLLIQSQEQADDLVLTYKEGYGTWAHQMVELEDSFEKIAAYEVAYQFLSILTPRQALIVRYRMDNPDASDVDVEAALKISHTTMWRETARIQSAFVTYAKTTEQSWWHYLRRLYRKGYDDGDDN